jgi:fatty-acyl-CoA synthase
MPAYDYQMILKHILEQGVSWAPTQEIVFRDLVRETYATMYGRVLRLGAALQRLGVRLGDRVGVVERDSHRYLEMYFGIPGIGATLHTINPSLAPEIMLFTMVHAEDDVIIFHDEFLPLIEAARPHLPTVRKYILISDKPDKPSVPWVDAEYEAWLSAAPPLPELPDFDENTVATLFYTTGTTGRPKGVTFTHRQLTILVSAGLAPILIFRNGAPVSKHEVYMSLIPMFHAHGGGMPYTATFLGMKQVFAGKYDPSMLVSLILEEKVTVTQLVPAVLQMIVSDPRVDHINLLAIIGGTRLPEGLHRAASAKGIECCPGYGMSEAGPSIAAGMLKCFMEKEWDAERQLEQSLKTGSPFPFVKVRVVDADGADATHDGKQIGEVVIRSPWITHQYLKDPERTEELWAGGWMHTGDLATMDEYGYLQIVDRLKDVIKSGGEWIVSLDIESLLSLHPDVFEAAVIGVPDPRWDERPLAVVAPKPGARGTLCSDQLRQHLLSFVKEGALTKWAVPERYEFVDALPRTSVGKIDKKVLRAQYGAPRSA